MFETALGPKIPNIVYELASSALRHYTKMLQINLLYYTFTDETQTALFSLRLQYIIQQVSNVPLFAASGCPFKDTQMR